MPQTSARKLSARLVSTRSTAGPWLGGYLDHRTDRYCNSHRCRHLSTKCEFVASITIMPAVHGTQPIGQGGCRSTRTVFLAPHRQHLARTISSWHASASPPGRKRSRISGASTMYLLRQYSLNLFARTPRRGIVLYIPCKDSDTS